MRLLATILAMVWVVSASATDCSAQDQDDAVGYTQKRYKVHLPLGKLLDDGVPMYFHEQTDESVDEDSRRIFDLAALDDINKELSNSADSLDVAESRDDQPKEVTTTTTSKPAGAPKERLLQWFRESKLRKAPRPGQPKTYLR